MRGAPLAVPVVALWVGQATVVDIRVLGGGRHPGQGPSSETADYDSGTRYYIGGSIIGKVQYLRIRYMVPS